MGRAPILIALCLAACGTWPDVDGPVQDRGEKGWPTLLPLDDVLGGAPEPRLSEADPEALLSRAAALRARAQVMRGERVFSLAKRVARYFGGHGGFSGWNVGFESVIIADWHSVNLFRWRSRPVRHTRHLF